jgi:hypothetical protein
VMRLVTVAQTAQDLHGVVHRRSSTRIC